ACDPAANDQKIYERWIKSFSGLSADERARLWNYFKSKKPRAIADLFQNHLFPPRGAWVKGDAFADRMGFLLPSELEALQATLAAAAEDTATTYNVFTRRYPNAQLYSHSDLPAWLKFWPQNGENTAALDNALRELSKWVNGEGPLAVDPIFARELVRRSIGDTLSIRSLLDFVSNPQFHPAQRQVILSEAARVLNLGDIEGDLLGLVMRANARMNGRNPLPSKAELSTVKSALKDGWRVKLIPTDKKLDGPTPDIEVTDAKGRKVVVEVKTVRRLSQEDRSLGYLTTLRAQIADAARQLDKYDAGDARRVVHIYIVGCGVGQVSSLAMQVAEDAVAEYEAQRGIAEIALIPVDTTGDSWREAEWVRGTFEEKEEYLNRNWKILECLSPNERRRALQLLHDEWERGAPLERGPFEEYVTRRVAALASGASAEGKDAAAAAGERDRTEEGRKEGAGRDRPEDKEKADRPAEGVK
ncbi:MAG: hypothetical protein HYU98_06670, partial [Deltaproteobacteria bacterium]|nr:hypothetical protein [Deltaproteobacteria bacterium]